MFRIHHTYRPCITDAYYAALGVIETRERITRTLKDRHEHDVGLMIDDENAALAWRRYVWSLRGPVVTPVRTVAP